MGLFTASLSRILWPYLKAQGEPFAWQERWQLKHYSLQPVDLWVHTASLGEISPFLPVLEGLKSTQRIGVTVTSGRSFEAVQRRLEGIAQVVPLPVEGSPGMEALLQGFKPRRLIVLESEFWPLLLRSTLSRRIPVYFLGARTRGLKNWLWKWLLLRNAGVQGIEGIWVSTEEERQQFVKLGIPEGLLHTGFHPKLLTPPPPPLPQAFANLERLPTPRLVAGSLHVGELPPLFQIFEKLRELFPSLHLLVIPRYPREGQAFLRAAKEKGLSAALWPDLKPMTIVDRFGVLPSLYSLGQAAIVGGSFIPLGGHNPVEALYHGVPVVLGPHTSHLDNLLPLLPEEGIHRVRNAGEATETLARIIRTPLHSAEKERWKEVLFLQQQRTASLISGLFQVLP